METGNYFQIFSPELPPYEEFYENYMQKNIACLFDSKLTNDWICRHQWLRNGLINFDFLIEKYGTLLVPIYNCDEKYFNSNPKTEIKFIEYVNYWKKVIEIDKNKFQKESDLSILYLKDWHLAKDSNDSSFYNLPIYFQSDYLNEYCNEKNLNDFKFTYMGPKFSSTPLHVDVFGSFSWSANVIGTKKWLMIPKCNVPVFKTLVPEIPHDFYALPNYKEIMDKIDAFEIIQKTGQVLFVPSGYMHQVINLEDTISINHNWFNACNIDFIYDNLILAFQEVKNQMIDLKNDPEWSEICQNVLTVHFGMNLHYFIDMIRHTTLCAINKESQDSFHFLKDTETMKRVYSKIVENADFHKLLNKNDWKFIKYLNKM